jgi:hypothetical protein
MRKPIAKPAAKPVTVIKKRRATATDVNDKREQQMALLIGTLVHASFSAQYTTVQSALEMDPKLVATKAFKRWRDDNQRTLEKISKLHGFEARVEATMLGKR